MCSPGHNPGSHSGLGLRREADFWEATLGQCCNSGKPLSLSPLQLSELMSEKRREVEKEHERRMERMREEHREALARIQEQYEEEVLLVGRRLQSV